MAYITISLPIGDVDVDLDLNEIAENIDIDDKIEDRFQYHMDAEIPDMIREYVKEELSELGLDPETGYRVNEHEQRLDVLDQNLDKFSGDGLPVTEQELEELAKKLLPFILKEYMNRLISVG